MKARLQDIAGKLDPLQLLDEIRRMQQKLAELADGRHPSEATRGDDDLTRFLSGLATAWHQGEVRATHAARAKKARYWRTRRDPFEKVWPTILEWLDTTPDQTGKDIFMRLQVEFPGEVTRAQLRTLQRRVKQWRNQMAYRMVTGVISGINGAIATTNAGNIVAEAAG